MNSTRKLFKTTIINLLNQYGTDEVLSEAALPAYAHKNFIIDYIFWQRLSVANNYILKNYDINSTILDFGCGTGVMSYNLAINGFNVTAIDLDLKPIQVLKENINYPQSIDFIEGNILDIQFNDKKFDVIVALDVLEHIPLDKLPLFLEKFKSLLNPNGVIIVSGPTENILYKIGRKLAGNDFTGHYHETTISKIKTTFYNYYKVKTLKKLIWPFVLFEIFSATSKND